MGDVESSGPACNLSALLFLLVSLKSAVCILSIYEIATWVIVFSLINVALTSRFLKHGDTFK